MYCGKRLLGKGYLLKSTHLPKTFKYTTFRSNNTLLSYLWLLSYLFRVQSLISYDSSCFTVIIISCRNSLNSASYYHPKIKKSLFFIPTEWMHDQWFFIEIEILSVQLLLTTKWYIQLVYPLHLLRCNRKRTIIFVSKFIRINILKNLTQRK